MGISFDVPQRVRIERIHLINFKGVSEGTIEFNCLKNPFEKEVQSDILGIYGQNGSGKTTILEAIHLAKLLMTGRRVSEKELAGIISQDAENARMEITFQFTNPDESLFHIEYAFSIKTADVYTSELQRIRNEIMHSADDKAAGNLASAVLADVWEKNEVSLGNCLEIYDEVISLSGCFDGVEYRFAPLFDTRSDEFAFVPKAKHSAFFPYDTKSVMNDLKRYKQRSKYSSGSFIFSDEVIQLIKEQKTNNASTPFGDLLCNLRLFARNGIRVLDSVMIGASRDQQVVIYTAYRGVRINLNDSTTYVDEQGLETLKTGILGLNVIISQLIPGLSLEAVEQIEVNISDNVIKKTTQGRKVKVYSVRDNIRIPLAQESTGILHLISVLGLLAYAFANPLAVVAIDEIDAGVYEYLLGELLLLFEEFGRGQLIFTCHNLRPMEVLNKKFVCFTTTNTYNRYLKLKSVRKERNLRDAYLSEIKDSNQDEELYSSAMHGKIAAAMMKAGEILGKEA